MTDLEQSLFRGMQSKCIRLELEIIRIHSALDSIARLQKLGYFDERKHEKTPVPIVFDYIRPDWNCRHHHPILGLRESTQYG